MERPTLRFYGPCRRAYCPIPWNMNRISPADLIAA